MKLEESLGNIYKKKVQLVLTNTIMVLKYLNKYVKFNHVNLIENQLVSSNEAVQKCGQSKMDLWIYGRRKLKPRQTGLIVTCNTQSLRGCVKEVNQMVVFQ